MLCTSPSSSSRSFDDQLRLIAGDESLLDEIDIARAVYERYYCRPRAYSAHGSDREERARFVMGLSQANSGTGHWQRGWNIVGRDGDAIVVERDRVRFYADPSQVRSSGKVSDTRCHVRLGKEMRALVPGFYCAFGNAEAEGEPLVRIYCNVRADGAPRFIAAVTRYFNEADVPFQVKVLSDPTAYVRADAGVLYLERRDVERAVPLVATVYRSIEQSLENDVPFFTCRIARGMALAEDPRSPLSFGQSRSEVVGLCLQGFKESRETAGARYRALCHCLPTAGISLKEPFLCEGSTDTYAALRGALRHAL